MSERHETFRVREGFVYDSTHRLILVRRSTDADALQAIADDVGVQGMVRREAAMCAKLIRQGRRMAGTHGLEDWLHKHRRSLARRPGVREAIEAARIRADAFGGSA